MTSRFYGKTTQLPHKSRGNRLQSNIVKGCTVFFKPQIQGNDKYVQICQLNKRKKSDGQFHNQTHTGTLTDLQLIFTSSGGKRPLLWADIIKNSQCRQQMIIFRLKAVILSTHSTTTVRATLSVVKRLFIAHLLVVSHVTKAKWRHARMHERAIKVIKQSDWLNKVFTLVISYACIQLLQIKGFS